MATLRRVVDESSNEAQLGKCALVLTTSGEHQDLAVKSLVRIQRLAALQLSNAIVRAWRV